MKNAIFSLIKVFAIVLVFTISTNINASTEMDTVKSLDFNLTTMSTAAPTSLFITPLSSQFLDKLNAFVNGLFGESNKSSKKTEASKKKKKKEKKPRGEKTKKPRGCHVHQNCSNNCPGQGEEPDPSPDNIPLDGGLSFLVLGAAAFGIRKLRGQKNDKI